MQHNATQCDNTQCSKFKIKIYLSCVLSARGTKRSAFRRFAVRRFRTTAGRRPGANATDPRGYSIVRNLIWKNMWPGIISWSHIGADSGSQKRYCSMGKTSWNGIQNGSRDHLPHSQAFFAQNPTISDVQNRQKNMWPGIISWSPGSSHATQCDNTQCSKFKFKIYKFGI